MPIKQIVREQADLPANLRDLVSNMVYVGVVAQMVGIDLEMIRAALTFHFKGKEKPIALNFNTVKAAAEWARLNLVKRDPFYVEPMDKTQGLIMADGNTAGALGSIYGGLQFTGWYPITPASSMAESLNEFLPMLRKREDGRHTYAVVQAEDELAAVGMTIGAGWSGLRSMTSTSGPGLSLMTEFVGLAYYTEVPLVIWDVQRIGPSTGLPTRTSQGDLSFTAHMGHGDTQQVILLPGGVDECFEFGWKSLDLAERLQTPIFVLSDLDMGMNQWMCKPFQYPETPLDRGKILWEKDLDELKETWGRYLDTDGDGIPYRTVPGNKHPLGAYFLRGTGHDEYAKYSEDPSVWLRNMDRLKMKYETAKKYVPAPVLHTTKGAQIGIIAYGSTEAAVEEARYLMQKEDGVKADFLRVRALPCNKDVQKFIAKHEVVFVVEMNRDGQMHQLLTLEYPTQATKLVSVAYGDGMPASAKWVREGILAKYKKPVAQAVSKPVKATAAKKAAKAKSASTSKKVVKKAVSKKAVKKSTPKTGK
jgi:2-oxoglutarate ferredoxin oxidoreductase subunit alpha